LMPANLVFAGTSETTCWRSLGGYVRNRLSRREAVAAGAGRGASAAA
jgi:hypothetical protein